MDIKESNKRLSKKMNQVKSPWNKLSFGHKGQRNYG